jgi:hypothetical protein
MRALLVRVGADLSDGGGFWNGPVNSSTREFAYVAIPESSRLHPGLQKPYSALTPTLALFGSNLPKHLAGQTMHLDPDFSHLSYGDQGQRAVQIAAKLGQDDLLVFYAALRDVVPQPRLFYAIIGIYVIDRIEPACLVPRSCWDENAHTRRVLLPSANDIVVSAKPKISGRLEKCIHIGSFRTAATAPDKRPCYRVDPATLAAWGGLSVSDGFLQRSARLPEFNNAPQFYTWFQRHNPRLVAANN